MKKEHLDHLWLLAVGCIQFVTGAPLWLIKDYFWAAIVTALSVSWVVLSLILVTITHVKHTEECCYPDHITALSLGPCRLKKSTIHLEPDVEECSLGSLPDYALGIMVFVLLAAHVCIYVWRCVEQSPLFIEIDRKYLKWFFFTPEAYVTGMPMLISRGEKALTRGMRVCMVGMIICWFLLWWIFDRANKTWGCYPENTTLAGYNHGTCDNPSSVIPGRRHIPLLSHGGVVCVLIGVGLTMLYTIVYIYDAKQAAIMFETEGELLDTMAYSIGIDPDKRGKRMRTLAEQIEGIV